MKIDVGILKNAPGESFTYNFTVAENTIDWDGEEGQITAPLEVHLQAVYHDGELAISGRLDTQMVFNCSRCLQPFTYLLQENFTDEVPVDNVAELDLAALIREIFLTLLPYQPLCQADCRGLCARCGSNLNQEQCGCPAVEPDPRLAVLQKLLKK